MSMKNITVRVDEEVEGEAKDILSEIGIPVATAVNVFLKKVVSCGGIPFELKLDKPNRETIEAMEEAERIARDPNTKKYTNFAEILSEVQAEVRSEQI